MIRSKLWWMSAFVADLAFQFGCSTLLSSASSHETAADSAPIASETINCIRDHNCLLVPVKLDGHSCLMLFDTGADNITISRSTLSALGETLSTGEIPATVAGVGTRAGATSKSAATVSVGGSLRKSFPINIQENNLMQPILGINFFQDCSITVDLQNAKIVLNRQSPLAELKGETAPKGGTTIVGSFSCGNQVLVPVILNGCSTLMLLDSGSDGITFSQEQAAAVHLIVPENSRAEVHMGVAGAVHGVGLTVSKFAVGTLVKQNVKVSVIESPGMPYPLLGAEFLRDCVYTINKEHSQITFERI